MNQRRHIEVLEARCAELEAMRIEYQLLLNYLVVEHGVNGEFQLSSDKMKAIKPMTIKTEIKSFPQNGKYLSITRIDPEANGSEPKIITP